MLLESEQPVLELGQAGEIIWCEHFALHHGEIVLDLIEPAGVTGGMHHDDRRPSTGQALDASLTAVRRTIVHHPEHARSRTLGFLGHHWVDKALKGGDTAFGLTAPVDSRAADVPGREISPRTFTFVLVLDPHGLAGLRRLGGMAAVPCLNAGLLVGGDDTVPWR